MPNIFIVLLEWKVRMNAVIITGGYINLDFLKVYLSENDYDYIIACDKGLEAVDKINISVDLIFPGSNVFKVVLSPKSYS